MPNPHAPPHNLYYRARVYRDPDFLRKTWRHRHAPIAVQFSRCQLSGDLPDRYRVLKRAGDRMVMHSTHRTMRAALKEAARQAKGVLV